MKKMLYLILILAIGCVGGIAVAATAFAFVYEAECDKVFIETVEELYPDQILNLTAQKELLYDIYLEPLGYLYQFELDYTENYAIIINADGFYECTEIYFDAKNPYENLQGIKIYVTAFIYWIYDNGTYYSENGLEISNEMFEHFAGRSYLAALPAGATTTSETVTFTSRIDNKNELALRVPQYAGIGSCVPIAGGNIIQFYTRYFPNLMPGYTPGSFLSTAYLYKLTSTELEQMVAKLAIDMGTGSNGGTTVAQFKSGMTTFVNRQGHSISFSSSMTNGPLSSFNYTTAKQRFAANQPLVVFCDPWTAATLTVSGSQEIINTLIDTIPHAMASFGYREITYTFANNTTRTDNYLQVSTAFDSRPTGYCKLNSQTVFDDAYAISIT